MNPSTGSPNRQVSQQMAQGLRWRLMVLIIFLLLAAQATLSIFALRSFEQVLAPQVHKQAEIIGKTVADQIEQALDLQIPLDRLVGMAEFLEAILLDNSDIDYLAVVNPDGQLIFQKGLDGDLTDNRFFALKLDSGAAAPVLATTERHFDTGVPLRLNATTPAGNDAPGALVGVLHVGVAKTFVQSELEEILYDVLTVLLVSMLVTLELLLLFVVVRISMPIRHVTQVMQRVTAGDFTRRITLRSNDEIGRFCRAFDQLVRRVNEQFYELVQEAEETKAGQIDRTIVQRIDNLVEKVRSKFQFSEPGLERTEQSASALRVRAPLFLFMFSEELSRSFLPLYVRELYSPIDGISVDLVVGLPITLFMAVVAIMTPFAGVWADRFGPKRLFLLGTIPAMIGYLGACLAQGLTDFLVWRALSAVGYGLIFIAAQSYIGRKTDNNNRAQGMGTFVGAVAAAGICGPSIGGILADRVGYRATFLIAMFLAIIAAFVVYSMLDEEKRNSDKPARASFNDVMALLSDRTFFATTVFAAIPTKLLLSGFLFYLAPLYLFELGNSQSAIGRIMMVYGLVTIALTPLISRAADFKGRYSLFVALGGFVAGGGCLAILTVEDSWTVLAAIALMGFGHAAIMAPQLAAIQQIGASGRTGIGQATVVSAFRLLERLGTILGPVVAGILVTSLGYQHAVAAMGGIVLICAILYSLSLIRPAQPYERRLEA